jgi:hypothetical protein
MVRWIADALTALLVAALLAVGGQGAYLAVREYRKPEPPPAALAPDYVLKRFEIRLREPIDGKRGDRYFALDCREVPR